MKICVLTGRAYANLYVRTLPLMKQLAKHGISYKLVITKNVKKPFQKYIETITPYGIKDFLDIVRNTEFDVLFISYLSSAPTWLLQKIYKRFNARVKIFFDLCDATFLSKKKLIKSIYIRTPAILHLERIIRDADYVTASSHYTLQYMQKINRNCKLIHDPIDTYIINPRWKTDSDKLTIGWEGNPIEHFYCLKMLIKPLNEISRHYDFRLKIVSWLGYTNLKQMFKKLERSIEVDYGSNRWLPYLKHIALCRDFDIILAPLQKKPWYEGKSARRVSLGMAMGIPVIASPVGEQKYVIRHGFNGFFARSEEEWYKYLKLLIEDDRLRKEVGSKGRETAEKELSLEVNGKKLYDLISQTIIEK